MSAGSGETRSREPTVEELHLLRGEILGSPLVIERAPGVVGLPIRGELVDESLHTVLVRIPGHARVRRIAKAGLSGTILLGGRELPLSGDTLRVRPEDRTKRLSLAGPKRSR